MAERNGSRLCSVATHPSFRHTQLISLVSVLSAPRTAWPYSERRQLVVDSRLQWATQPVDGQSSWLYLEQPARVLHMADCLVFIADD
jgi:hypothetical protein